MAKDLDIDEDEFNTALPSLSTESERAGIKNICPDEGDSTG
jgi:hypothetical protein